MNKLKNVFELYLNSSIHVALAVVAFALVTYLNYGVAIDNNLILFIFFASITGYNFVKYAGIAGLHHLSLTQNLRLIQVFSLLCFLMLGYLSLHLSFNLLLWIAGMGVLTLLYALPFLTKKRNLRSLPGIKIFVIAMVWAGVTVILPIIESGHFTPGTIILDFIQRFLFVIVLTLPFEIRDLKYDLYGLKTLPQVFGVRRIKFIGVGILVFNFIIALFQKDPAYQLFVLGLTLLITMLFVLKSKKEQKKFYASFWVESIPVFYFLMLVLFRNFRLPFFG